MAHLESAWRHTSLQLLQVGSDKYAVGRRRAYGRIRCNCPTVVQIWNKVLVRNGHPVFYWCGIMRVLLVLIEICGDHSLSDASHRLFRCYTDITKGMGGTEERKRDSVDDNGHLVDAQF